MTISINISRKTLVIALTAFLLLFGAVNVFASHDTDFIHVCFKDSGQIKVANQASDCKEDETATTLVTEEAYLALLARVDQLEVALNAESAARQQADAALGTQVDAIQATTDALADLLAHFTRDGDQILITGANLHVLNGTGATDSTPNSLGNLIIGYNELRGFENDRSGSHMLVVGSENNYSSFGGIVVGKTNETSAPFASVNGGSSNTASGKWASVSGGVFNHASGKWASVSGGLSNYAIGEVASVSGGHSNYAVGNAASVSGGYQGLAPDVYDWVAGDLFEDK